MLYWARLWLRLIGVLVDAIVERFDRRRRSPLPYHVQIVFHTRPTNGELKAVNDVMGALNQFEFEGWQPGEVQVVGFRCNEQVWGGACAEYSGKLPIEDHDVVDFRRLPFAGGDT